MTSRRVTCVHDRPRITDRCRKMGRKPRDAGRCSVRGWLEPLAACRERRNGRLSALESRQCGEFRLRKELSMKIMSVLLPSMLLSFVTTTAVFAADTRAAIVLNSRKDPILCTIFTLNLVLSTNPNINVVTSSGNVLLTCKYTIPSGFLIILFTHPAMMARYGCGAVRAQA